MFIFELSFKAGNELWIGESEVVAVDVVLGVHAEDAVIGSGTHMDAGRDGTTAVVGGCGLFDLPDIVLDGTDGIKMDEVACGQFAGDVGEGGGLLFVAEGEPIAARAFFFFAAGAVVE